MPQASFFKGDVHKNPSPLWMHNRVQTASLNKLLLRELLFYLAFIAFILKYTLDVTALLDRINILNSALVSICIACSVAKILLQRYTLLRLVASIIICIVIGLSCMRSTNYYFLLGFLLVMGMQDISLERVIRFSFIAKIISIGIHILIYIPVYFLNPESISFVFRGGDTMVPRHFFFMGHANTFSAYVIWTCFDYIFLNYKNLNIWRFVIIWVISLVFYSFTYTNTSLIVLTIASVFIALDKWSRINPDKLLTFLAKYIYAFCAVFFPYLVAVYTRLGTMHREMWHNLDDLLTGRLWLGAYAYYRHGMTFFGRPDIRSEIAYWEGRWFDTMTIFDNHYIGNYVSYGIINSILVALVIIVIAGRMEIREKIMIISFSYYCIMDVQAMTVVICSAPFIIGKYLYVTGRTRTSLIL